MNKNKDIQKKIENRSVIIIILVLMLIMLVAFIEIVKNGFISNFSNDSVVLNPINTNISSKDGKNHSVSAEFAISGNYRKINKLNKDAINLIILDEMKKLNFEDITGPNGDEKLKQSILKVLNEKYKEIHKIYIKKFTTDIEVNKDNNKNKNNREDYLKGFRWNKNDK